MKRKGWWQQLRDNDYPETKKSYGQDIHAIDPRIRPKNLEARLAGAHADQCRNTLYAVWCQIA
jgi:hypothetical protein